MAANICEPRLYAFRSKTMTVSSHTVFDASTAAMGKGLASATNLNRSATFSKSGYTPFGIVGFYFDGDYTSFINVYELYLSARSSGSATVRVSIRNITGSGTSTAHSMDVKMTVHILWIKNE